MTDPFRCICPAPPLAVPGCSAHRHRYAAQQYLARHPDPSPADLRNNLNHAHVAALAQQLHALRCLHVTGTDPHRGDPDHPLVDLAAARFLLLGLREDHQLTLTTTTSS